MSRRASALLAVTSALAGLVLSCASPHREPAPAASAEPPPTSTPSTTPSVELPAAASRPTAEPTSTPDERCDPKLSKVTFSECYTRPRTLSYPDCRRYDVERIEHDATCRPERLLLSITGYQSIVDLLEVNIVWETGPPQKAHLVLGRVVSSIFPYPTYEDKALGTIVFEKGEPHKLLIGPGLRSHTDQPSAKRLDLAPAPPSK